MALLRSGARRASLLSPTSPREATAPRRFGRHTIGLPIALALSTAFVACSANNPSSVFADPEATAGTGGTGGAQAAAGAGSDTAAGSAGEGSGEGGAGGDQGTAGSTGIEIDPGNGTSACGELGSYVFVVSDASDLLRFRPQEGTFEKIGTIKCPTKSSSSTPFSMSVDRHGKAWINYSGGDAGQVFLVDTETAACEKSPYDSSYAISKGWKNFGMAFVADGNGGAGETLYLSDATNFAVGVLGKDQGLARVNPDDGKIEPIDQFSDSTIVKRGGLDLSGRGDGKLFAFVVDGAAQGSPLVAEVDKENATILSTVNQTSLPKSITAWAFAHWGGSLYLFHAEGSLFGDGKSQVSKYTPDVGTELVLEKTPYRIVGAGVSTCAPLAPPK
jgi:hypothetical protein